MDFENIVAIFTNHPTYPGYEVSVKDWNNAAEHFTWNYSWHYSLAKDHYYVLRKTEKGHRLFYYNRNDGKPWVSLIDFISSHNWRQEGFLRFKADTAINIF